jgi:hypothetical protein
MLRLVFFVQGHGCCFDCCKPEMHGLADSQVFLPLLVSLGLFTAAGEL